jgi:hypothetical protein
MKKIFTTLLFTVVSLVCYSQKFTDRAFGVKGGMNFSKLYFNRQIERNWGTGYYVGISGRLGDKETFLQGELYLSSKNNSMTSPSKHTNDLNFTSLDVPILVGAKIGATGMEVVTGPVFMLFLSDKQQFEETAPIIFRGQFKNKAIGWQFGLGWNIGRFNIDGRYETGVSKINLEDGYPTTKMRLFSLGLGVDIF